MTAASCKPSRYRSSFSVANASISGNSVVPGFPNMISTPSCLSRSRKARFPDITGKTFSQGWGVGGGASRRRSCRQRQRWNKQPRLRSHIIERRCAASEGWRAQEGRGFRRGQDAKREPDDGEHLAARSEKLRDAQKLRDA